MFRNFFLRRALTRVAGRLAPDLVPVAGRDAALRDYYLAELGWRENNQASSVLLTGVNSHGIEGLWWDGNRYDAPCSVSWDAVAHSTVELSRYLKRHDFFSTKPWVFELGCALGLYRSSVALEGARQWLYNKRSPTTVDRLNVLKYIVEKEIKGHRNGFTSVTLAADFHSIRSVFHPRRRERYAYYGLVLRSLEDEGLLENRNGAFVLRPRALTALHSYENEERRHRTNFKIQIGIAVLTVCSVLAAAAQAWPQAKEIWGTVRSYVGW